MLIHELNHPSVKYIEVDQFVSIQYKQEEHKRDLTAADVQTGATWVSNWRCIQIVYYLTTLQGLDRIDQRSMPLDGQYAYNSSAGSNTDVYVIDTYVLEVFSIDHSFKSLQGVLTLLTMNLEGVQCWHIMGSPKKRAKIEMVCWRRMERQRK